MNFKNLVKLFQYRDVGIYLLADLSRWFANLLVSIC